MKQLSSPKALCATLLNPPNWLLLVIKSIKIHSDKKRDEKETKLGLTDRPHKFDIDEIDTITFQTFRQFLFFFLVY